MLKDIGMDHSFNTNTRLLVYIYIVIILYITGLHISHIIPIYEVNHQLALDSAFDNKDTNY